MSNRKVGMWLYKNGGGDKIGRKIIKKLKEREIDVLDDINLRHAIAKNAHIIYHGEEHYGEKLDKLDLFFSYNAGEQTLYQMYLYQALNRMIPMINSYDSFALTEDKFHTSFVLRNNGVKTADYKLCHRDDGHEPPIQV
jgi:ribosomal protein S6--L-glutamate ligase